MAALQDQTAEQVKCDHPKIPDLYSPLNQPKELKP
jgi:hypothetical protein